MKDAEQFAYVFEVQAGGGLIENVDGATRRALLQFAGELHPLRLSPGQRRCRLTHANVSKPHIDQRGQMSSDSRHRLEEGQGVFYRKIQHLGDGLALVMDLQRLSVVPITVTNLAWNIDIGKEVHFDPYRAVAAAGFTSSSLHVEGEATRLISPHLGLCGRGKKLANVIENARIRRRVAPWRTSDGTLVDVHNLVDLISTRDAFVLSWHEPGAVQVSSQDVVQNVVDQGRLA